MDMRFEMASESSQSALGNNCRSGLDAELAFFKEAGFNNLLLPGGEQSLTWLKNTAWTPSFSPLTESPARGESTAKKQLGEYYASFSQHPAF